MSILCMHCGSIRIYTILCTVMKAVSTGYLIPSSMSKHSTQSVSSSVSRWLGGVKKASHVPSFRPLWHSAWLPSLLVSEQLVTLPPATRV